MNAYAYSPIDQPAVPPRRKRSLSTSRSDYTSISQDLPGMPFQSNRIGKRNFSTDHIPGGYAYSGTKPLGMGYTSGSQQAISGAHNYGNGNYNGYLPNYPNRQPIAYQGSDQFPHSFAPAHLQSPQHLQQNQAFQQLPHHLQQQNHLQNQNQNFIQNQNPNQNSNLQRSASQQNHHQQGYQSKTGRAPYNSNGSNLNNLQSLTNPAMNTEQPMPIPRFMNPYAVPSSKVAPMRAHQDYLKYAQPNVHYNPYQSQFSPTLMARPDIHPLAKPEQVASFQKRDRSPYNSREQLNNLPQQSAQSALSPQRPPPPKSQNPGRLSVENLSTPTAGDYEAHLNSQLRDRRSVSPTRYSPGAQMLASQQANSNQQRPYGASRHSTSPLPGSNGLENRYGSRSSLNSPTSGYISPRITSSRESSPFTRPVSPFGRPSSPFSSFGTDSVGLSHRTRSYSSSVTGMNRLDRSISSQYGCSAINSGLSSNRYDRSISLSSNTGSSMLSPTLSSSITTANKVDDSESHDYDKLSAEANAIDKNSLSSAISDTNSIDCSNITTEPETDSLSTLDSSQNPGVMDSLQVPMAGDSTGMHQNSPQNRHQQQNPQFSEAFTDHCDQYKSVTSKILGKSSKTANRNSGEFGEVYNELSQHLQQQEQFQQNAGYDDFGMEYQQERTLTPEQKPTQDPYLEEKKVLENQLFNSPSASRVASRNNSLAFDTFGSPASSRKNSTTNLNDPFARSPTTSRRNSASAATAASRKGSLPTDYLAHPDSFALSNDWSREKVANLAHEARQRAHNPRGNDSLKKVGAWITKQFVFLMIAGVNVLIAYAFYNLFTMLPADI